MSLGNYGSGSTVDKFPHQGDHFALFFARHNDILLLYPTHTFIAALFVQLGNYEWVKDVAFPIWFAVIALSYAFFETRKQYRR